MIKIGLYQLKILNLQCRLRLNLIIMKRVITKIFKSVFPLSIFLLLIIQGCDKSDNEAAPKGIVTKPATWIEYLGELPDPCKSVCLISDQDYSAGNINLAEKGDFLLLTYNVAVPDVYIKELQLEVFRTVRDLYDEGKIDGSGPLPEKFEYQVTWGDRSRAKSHTAGIPLSEITGVNACVFITARAELTNGDIVWGGLCDIDGSDITTDGAKQFPGTSWAIYFEFCRDECSTLIDFTYAWEDQRDLKNDMDYNDLVIKSDVLKSNTELKITFIGAARGAGYDHEFKIKIPMHGIEDIFGDEGTEDDGTYYYITVFSSTREVLKPEHKSGSYFATNTASGDNTCDPQAVKEIYMTINEDFVFDESKPYEPFITVWPSQVVGKGESYDLYLWEVSGRDTWLTKSGREYPNGILIPDDWHWPYETVAITEPYPEFTSITEGWNPDWANNLAVDSLIWSCNQ